MPSMTHHDGHDELRRLADRLRENRPTATPLELDALKQRVLASAARPSSPTRRSLALMRTRAAILFMLVFGFLLSTTGAGLAVSGLADNDQAATAQYPETAPPPPTPTPPTTNSTPPAPQPGGGSPPDSGVLPGQQESPPEPCVPGEDSPSASDECQPVQDEVLPEQQNVAPEASDVQPTRQVEAGADGGSLPFTGFAALPVMLVGIALLSGGLIMRRSSRTG
jgi:hypothetical protein